MHSKKGDIDEFFRLIIASGESSWKLLQNVYVAGSTEEPFRAGAGDEPPYAGGQGRIWRIHGGGFAGTILTFVPNDMLKTFTRKMEDVFGAHSCTVLDIRHAGALSSGRSDRINESRESDECSARVFAWGG